MKTVSNLFSKGKPLHICPHFCAHSLRLGLVYTTRQRHRCRPRHLPKLGTGPNRHGIDIDSADGNGAVSCKWSHWPQCILFFAVDGACAVAVSCKRALSIVYNCIITLTIPDFIFRSDCLRLLNDCVDWGRLPPEQSPDSICRMLSAQEDQSSCIPLSKYTSKYSLIYHVRLMPNRE